MDEDIDVLTELSKDNRTTGLYIVLILIIFYQVYESHRRDMILQGQIRKNGDLLHQYENEVDKQKITIYTSKLEDIKNDENEKRESMMKSFRDGFCVAGLTSFITGGVASGLTSGVTVGLVKTMYTGLLN